MLHTAAELKQQGGTPVSKMITEHLSYKPTHGQSNRGQVMHINCPTAPLAYKTAVQMIIYVYCTPVSIHSAQCVNSQNAINAYSQKRDVTTIFCCCGSCFPSASMV